MTTAEQYLATVRRHYPDAHTTVESVERHLDLFHRRFGLRTSDVLLADSICADDVTSIEYPKRAFEMPGPFKLGGLDGFPFAGLTGMGAFAAHVPDEGAVFVYHAPHIGVSQDGTVGTIRRVGQSAPSGCCGACRAALARLQAGQIEPGLIDDLDYQQHTLEQILLRQSARILAAANPLMEATEVMCEAITERIDLLAARTTYRARYLILSGAILINGDHDMGSYTAPRRLIATDLRNGAVMDLLPEYRG